MVRCVDCGLLALKDGVSKELIEADPSMRASGDYINSMGNQKQVVFFCYASKRQFSAEESGAQSRMVEALKREHNCEDGFTTYFQGRTAKEHEDMNILQRVDAANRASQAEMARRQEESDRKQDARYDRTEKRQDRADLRQVVSLRMSFAALVMSVLMGFLGPLGVEGVKRWLGWSAVHPISVQPEQGHQLRPTDGDAPQGISN
jgi:hypothetical protein